MSNYYNLLLAVQNSLTGIPMIPPIVVRDDIFMLTGDKAPLIIVSPGPDKEVIRLQTFGNNIVYDYGVIVAYIVPGNRFLFADLQQFMQIRENMRNNLYQLKYPGLSNCWDVGIDISSVNKFASLIDTNYRVSGFRLIYSIAETRTGI